MSSAIQINGEAFRHLRWAHGLHQNKDFAEAIGVNAGTTSRIMQGVSAPGGRFIGKVLDRFPVRFEELFVIADEDDTDLIAVGHSPEEHAALGDTAD